MLMVDDVVKRLNELKDESREMCSKRDAEFRCMQLDELINKLEDSRSQFRWDEVMVLMNMVKGKY